MSDYDRNLLELAQSLNGLSPEEFNRKMNAAVQPKSLIEEQAARIAELEQKLRTTSMEALAISDTNNELAARVASLEKQRDHWQSMHDARTKMLGDCATERDYNASVAEFHDGNSKRWHQSFIASQARLSEAVKVLEEAIGQIAGDAIAIDGEWGSGRDRDELDKAGEMPDAYYMAKAFISTLGENKNEA